MLVFNTRVGERMWISNTVELSVLGVHGNTVWLGFTAPPGVPIDRGERLCVEAQSFRDDAGFVTQEEELTTAAARLKT